MLCVLSFDCHSGHQCWQVIFEWVQVKTEIYWPTGQMDFTLFLFPALELISFCRNVLVQLRLILAHAG